MRQIFIYSLPLFFLMITFISHAYAEEKHVTAPRIEMLGDDTMKKLLQYGESTEQRQMLTSLVGEWDYDLKYWTNKNSEPQFSTGSVVNEMILGDRFLSSKTSVILNIGGQSIPYEGWGVLGYDTTKNAYTSVWVDTLSTGTTVGIGQYNKKTNTLEEKGRFTFPLLKNEQEYRSELELTNDETHKKSIFISDNSGKEFKVLELEFRRKR
ncbi:MAG: hypothetical protein AUJ12_09030 [Alphaproteobacteria bacterium CG1_02_46_17]|nr:MAG: hypothetical protein AUJ12_09030 [Alphaproteobacteria bacterium CG1_02_46_17]